MGHKTDRIRELEGELTAARHLLRHIGDTVGCEFEEPTTTAEAQREHHRFLTAFRAKMGVTRIDGGMMGGLLPDTRPPRRSRTVAPGGWDTHDEEVDEQIDRLAEQGLTTPPGGAMVHRDAGDAFSSLPSDDETNRSTIRNIARELGIGAQGDPDPGDLLARIYEEIIRVKNIGADTAAPSSNKALTKGDSLGDAIAHGHAQAADLREAAAQARMIVNRIAAVMQIGTWDKDGTELLERAQRWENWKYDLMKRIQELRVEGAGYAVSGGTGLLKSEASERATAIADELQRNLERLLAPQELARWLKANEKAAAAGVVKADAGLPVPPYPFQFVPSDVVPILAALEGWSDDLRIERQSDWRCDAMLGAFRDMHSSRVATEEFARTMNLVILPILARQRAAQKVPEDAGRPAE